MLSWRVRRRLVYLLLIVGVLVALGIVSFLASRPAPSCFDGKQNQDELAVDCGGPCEKPCPIELKALKVVWGPRILNVAPGRYDTVTLLQNPNPRHGVRLLRYRIKVFDAANLLITMRSGVTFLNPKENLVIFEGRIEVGQRVPARAVFELEEQPVWQKIERQAPPFRVERKALVNEPSPRLIATVTNESLVFLHDLTVVALLFDAAQNVIAGSSTLVEELAPGTPKEIIFTWPQPFDREIALITFYPHLDLARLPTP